MKAWGEPAKRSTFLTAWAVVLALSALLLGSLAVFTFGAVCFAGLLYLWWQEYRGRRCDSLYWMNGVMLALSTLWFVLNVLTEFLQSSGFQFGLLGIGFLYPALIVHLYYLESTAESGSRRMWRRLVGLTYVPSTGFASLIILMTFGVLPIPGDTYLLLLFIAFLGLFLFAGAFSAYMLSKSPMRRGKEGKQREQRRVNITLLLGMVLMVIAIILINIGKLFEFSNFLSVISRSLPLIFLFVNSYYENRFEFFDVFVKRATFFYLALILLIGYFALVPQLVERVDLEPWQLPWVFSLTLLPAVISLPWAYRTLGAWLDRYWLGRVFEPGNAIKYFLEGLGTAISPAELAAAAESRLAQVFQAPVAVRLAPGGQAVDPGFQVVQRVAIPSHDQDGGWILLGQRPNQTPWFGGDLTLVSAMAEVFSFMLQNLRLQARKQEQETREQQLVLEASRSELKALRAQINPHFLFNALNVIASLTHRDPDRAEQVVEELAEVFRYTLSRSEQEWVRLEDEIAFIEAYLAVEKARFGDRLQVQVEADPGVRQYLIPAMMVQTLVENAVKHGISAIRSRGSIQISARQEDGEVRITVADNGPGPSAADDDGPRARKSGFGLKNIRHRLQGYFGDQARLEVRRDPQSSTTIASIVMRADLLDTVPGRRS